ncbi:hypothetical protein LUZ61_012571 [Rhynchospora tenuis]|uniref:F-box domain-containing protein n=1 Tax=Rhynchospora tenuis TaxID=198213 RepID=A0AAD6F1B9_9POAL|nr:hypothetical protein LUZ61_012571 [Rhynchospora tenuis]
MASENAKIGVKTLFDILPDQVQEKILSLIEPTRARNSASVVCRRWRILERKTRSSLSLRGNVLSILDPSSISLADFPSLSSLDLSTLSPWGRVSSHSPLLTHPILSQKLPCVTSLTFYAHDPIAQEFLSNWPNLKRVKLLRFHISPTDPNIIAQSYLCPLFQNCTKIQELDLSEFCCCWTEAVTDAIVKNKPVAEGLTSLNLILGNASNGFRASELLSITAVCKNLRQLIAPCLSNPRYTDIVSNNDTLVKLATNCRHLTTLHLVDLNDNYSQESNPSVIAAANLETLLSLLPLVTDFSLNLYHPILDVGPALETLGHHRTNPIKSLKLGNFRGVCKGESSHLDGVSLCGELEFLSLKNCFDMSDDSLVAIAGGCNRLTKIEIIGCFLVTELGVQQLALGLRKTLKDFSLSNCGRISIEPLVKALKPLRGQLQRLHIDCAWIEPESKKEMHDILDEKNTSNGLREPGKWENLHELSLRLCAGQKLTPLLQIGLHDCPNMSSITIKVKGDLGVKPPSGTFNLEILSKFHNLSKLKLDLDMTTCNVLDYLFGTQVIYQSPWEEFYLVGIDKLLSLRELDYWPPQRMLPANGLSWQERLLFKAKNQRTLSPKGARLINGCFGLRNLVIHGTTDQDSMMPFSRMLYLRDAQLREDCYPTIDNDESTEMRTELCRRFELVLNDRWLQD